MKRDRLPILVVVVALLAAVLTGAALVAPSDAQDPDTSPWRATHAGPSRSHLGGA